MTSTAPATASVVTAPRTQATKASTRRGPSPLELLVGSVVVAIFLYEVLFNLLPSGIRLQMAGALAMGIVLLSLAWIVARPRIWRIILFALLLVVAGCWVMGEAGGEGKLDFAKGIRFLLPLFFALWIIELRRALDPRLLLFLAASTIIIAMLSSVLRPQEVIGSVMRLAPFTGGEKGAHASSYVLALCALQIHQLWLNRSISRRVAWSFLALAGLLLVGMRVATPIFMLLNYGLLHILFTRKLKGGTKILLWFTIVGSMVAVLVWHEAMQEQVRGEEIQSAENMGSGRVGTWLGRIDLLSRRSVPSLLFGTGPGSDSFYSEIWWWEKKDSHHDLLTTTIESGFLGLSSVFLFLFLLFRRLGRDGFPLAWFLISGSLVSNALMQRPIIATMFWIAVALAAIRIDEQLRVRWLQQRTRQQQMRRKQGLSGNGPARRRRRTEPSAP